ncbi:hypothetical protein M422DRAFT_177165, partial [Sphaerobolus stellatus SS14]
NAHLYPVWALLTLDYLPIMASSVSSERAFSAAGITITKRRNRLKRSPDCFNLGHEGDLTCAHHE